MSFFRRSSELSAREYFLVSALAAVGISEANIAEASEAKATDFLKSLDQSEKLAGLTVERDQFKAANDALVATVTGAGFSYGEIVNADAFSAAIEARIEKEASERAVELSAARGIKPVAQAPAAAVASANQEMKFSEFKALDHAKQNAFIRSGGKIIQD